MSRINRIRIINLTYNNNAIRIDDECLDLVNENTLLSLRNGGGKSVLIQMMTAPFVHKRYRDTADRPFASYFNSNQPTFILVEWSLDHEAGYVLTGMMVRKNQESKEEDENRPELEMINFIHEYSYENEFDLVNFPFVSQEGNKKMLQGFNPCKKLFETCKQNKQLKFDYYDMNQSARSRAYFTKLEEFQIYAKEWESIIKKVNLKESGLSELFKEAKDEKGLVEKWFLEAIENKLNQQNDRIKNFESLLKKYMIQYKANEGHFKKKEGILRFQEEMQTVCTLENQLLAGEESVFTYELNLAVLYATLQQLAQETETNSEQYIEQLNELKQQLHRLSYEEQSLAIYDLLQQQANVNADMLKQGQLLDSLKEQQNHTLKQQHIYETANRYQTYKQASIDVQRCESELKVAKQSQEELSPRLNDLGYSLSVAYEQQLELEEKALETVRQSIQQAQSDEKRLKTMLEVKQEDRQEAASQLGALTQAVKAFDEREAALIKKYQLELSRNLEGEYVVNTLENLSSSIQTELEQLKKQKKQYLEEEQQLKMKQHQVMRDYEDAKETLGGLKATIQNQQDAIQTLEDELTIRKQLSLYVAWPQDDLFNKDGMLEAFQAKRQVVKTRIREFERELDQVTKEYTKLQSGEVMELPTEFKAALKEEGVQYILGIDWLKRNQQSFEQNQALIKKNPFLPYSLILSNVEMQRFKGIQLQLNTPVPIPMLVREELEDALLNNEGNGHCYLKPLHFYVCFNEELLDEARLQQLLLLKERELTEIRQKLETQVSYLTRYDQQIGVLNYQTLSQSTYDEASKKLADSLATNDQLQQQLLQLQSDKESIAQALDRLAKALTDLSMQMQKTEQKQEDVASFMADYERYVSQVKQLKEVREQVALCLAEIELLNEQLGECLQTYEMLRSSEREKQFHLRATQISFQRFEHYVEGSLLQMDVEDLLAEFDAITEQLKGVLRRSEEDLVSAKQRFAYEEEELNRLMKRYDLVDADYQTLTYDPYAHEQVMALYEQLGLERETQSKVMGQLEIKLATLNTEEKNAYALLKRDLNETEPLPKSEVVKRDFASLKAQAQTKLNLLKETLHTLEKRLALYQREASHLVEYKQELDEVIVLEAADRLLDEKAWHDKRALLLRDYKEQLKVVDRLKHDITDEFNRIGRLDLFETDFFNLPFKNFLAVKHVPNTFIEQYDTMMKVFTHVLGQLAVDIAQSEDEKQTVIQLLLDYVQEIHKHLGFIDQNSSIHIRGKNIKMLRIKLPNWEENANLYAIRMNDFVTTLTTHCLELMQKNENIQEFIGHQVTTKQLYDQIVGTANVEIKLYKIEEQREYLITWEQVAKNSGGEGFLSAFVILSSLLSFMRRDETDIFSNFEEGKVLLMDNPFAQTNAAHLLKPLIELAKKNNTQLICLSGLGGDSIYSRFENIYSLSLVPSSFKKGCEYLKSQHIKGEVEPHLVIPSRVYVEDAVQEALLF